MFSFTEQSAMPLFDFVESSLVPEQKLVSTTFNGMAKSETQPLFSIGAPIQSTKSPLAMPPMEWEDGLLNPTWNEQPSSNFLAQETSTLQTSIPHEIESDAMMNFFNFDAASRPE